MRTLHLSAERVEADNFRSSTRAPFGQNFDARTELNMRRVGMYLLNLRTRVCDPLGLVCVPVRLTPDSFLTRIAELAIDVVPGLFLPYILRATPRPTWSQFSSASSGSRISARRRVRFPPEIALKVGLNEPISPPAAGS